MPSSAPSGQLPAQEPVSPGVAPRLLEREIAALPRSQFLLRRGASRVFWARAAQIPALLDEIGRLRELAFRGVGEGTGRSRDLDRFDPGYLHVFVWMPGTRELVGACRLISSDVAVSRAGPSGLYTHTLFDYGLAFLRRLGPALELGRSFVRPEYQGSSAALAALWQGLGRLIARLRAYPTLFGAVSISAHYSPAARALMSAVLEDWAAHAALDGRVRARVPLTGPPIPSRLVARLGTPDALERAVMRLDGERKGLPVLVRRYLELGARFVAFNVDPAFHDALDGLAVVDLRRTDPRLLGLYLGCEAREILLRQWRGSTTPEKGTQRSPVQLA
jgi:putative hemolysin